ncbi:molybdopterin-guanine dinucleotide biosynthesis protein MobB [Psychromonas sp. CNPT3]|uniref:molybdopterin-guanine dinucleotide biosynthesis protein B n=1 Tax=Psychromonas sp. CNPT3 TaxID=314282 RepID=UPI00006E70FC|nr:molybdopterin-guanine dinucleotide biosynthesis protein B [Psychromonas sp. CNPT3]AGH82302.1 molybdopterin-guanine dinucleotide biosynthesis protein MobB [Psychromonas sp. CNPT3]
MSLLIEFPIPVLGFAAFSGTGKTTLLEKLIPLLTAYGLKIALIKHSHHDIELDKPGKDSFRLRKAGLSQLVLAGTKRSILFKEYAQSADRKLIDQLTLLKTDELDLVLVEGYRDEGFAKIELHRSILNKPFLYPNDASIIALISDNIRVKHRLPVLNINDIEQVKMFIIEWLGHQ